MPSFSRDRPPVLLLDVDGVLNAFDRVPAARGGWDDWQHGGATAEGTRWPITWSPRVVATLSDWHEQGRVELRWLTTWGHDANDELRRLLGLPELPVAGTYHEAGGPSGAAETGGGHASVTPAAPDPLSGSWWKYDVVVSLLRTEPERRFVWVDDDLDRLDGAFARWAETQPSITTIVPDPRRGLTAADLEVIAALL
ncbi:MAG TPA: HAD domain-containing protein [Nocardioidaceae bacterium]|jgi:hypothetical protein|nr:HAD domain-containing protein [Nocardioidaceae bacterium]